jgi:translation initiation factor IF-1
MVKNTTGGTGTKSLGRKHQMHHDSRLRLSECEFEQYAIVTKMLGNSMCEIRLNDDTKLMGHIRNKFSGRNKRSNFISVMNIVLIGLRDYEKPFKNCDILTIYDETHVEQLKQIPSIDISNLIHIRTDTMYSSKKDSNIDFTYEQHDMDEKITTDNLKEFKMEATEEINIDDI